MALEIQPPQTSQEWTQDLAEFAESGRRNLMSTISDKRCKTKHMNRAINALVCSYIYIHKTKGVTNMQSLYLLNMISL